MPLRHDPSRAAREANIRREIRRGRDPRQAVAIAYRVQRAAAARKAARSRRRATR